MFFLHKYTLWDQYYYNLIREETNLIKTDITTEMEKIIIICLAIFFLEIVNKKKILNIIQKLYLSN